MVCRPVRAVLALALLAGCAEGGGLEDILVTEATLTDLKVGYGAVVVGVEGGSATLELLTVDDERIPVEVALLGPRVGLMIDLAFGIGLFDLPIVLPEDGLVSNDGVPANDLLGTYQGIEYGGAALVGMHYAILRNEAGAGLVLNTLDFGATASFDYAWITVSVAE